MLKTLFIIFSICLLSGFLWFEFNKRFLLKTIMINNFVKPIVLNNNDVQLSRLLVHICQAKNNNSNDSKPWCLIYLSIPSCNICLEELILLNDFANVFFNDLIILSIKVDDKYQLIDVFLDKYLLFINFIHYHKYNFDINKYLNKKPITFLLSPYGVITKFYGFRNWYSDEMMEYYINLL